MKRPKVKRDSESFYIDTPGGRIRSDEVGAIEAYLDQREQRAPGSAVVFLAAWKEGVVLAGERFFNVKSATPRAATDRDQLRPNLEMIQASLDVLSPGESVFLLSLYQFFSDSTVRDLCAESGVQMPSLVDIANLDTKRQSVITRLICSYGGW